MKAHFLAALIALTMVGPPIAAEAGRPVEVLAMGSNDFERPNLAGRCLAVAIANARAHGREPVVIMPNRGNPRVATAADVVARTAARLGVTSHVPQGWASDRLHPSNAAYRALAVEFDGEIVRGDSFAVGIIGKQAHRNSLSWGKIGVSSASVVARIAEIDDTSSHCALRRRATGQ